jgi:hypothetical protein
LASTNSLLLKKVVPKKMQSFFKKIPKQTYTVIKRQFIGPKYKGKNLRTHKIASCIAIQKSVKKV